MIESLHIRNFAIIDNLQLDFDRGLSALTGETGAGKSIMLDAIKLAAGDRADSEAIRSGAERAEISVCFNLETATEAREWLEENEMTADQECVIRRVLHSNGRSKAYINGSNATLQQLRALCDLLIDIHGQHEHQSLQKPQVQRQLLDAFIGDHRIIEEVQQKYARFRELEQQLEEARSGSHEREQRVDLLQLYCEEFKQLAMTPGELAGLNDEYRRLANAGDLIEKTGAILEQLDEDESSNVQSVLSRCAQDLAEMQQTDASLSGSHELINAALIQVQEAIGELRAYHDGIELDSNRLEAVNQRIATMQDLARKHRVEVGDLPGLAEQLQAELESLLGDHFDLETIQQSLDKAREDYMFSAGELSIKRQKTGERLSEQISEVMQQLGMQGGCFVIEVERQDTPGAHGIDRIRYLVSTNPGQSPKSLTRVASGGELSRISLAIQVIMSESSPIPTLIFDEVDAGVGGAVAEIVGKKLRLLGQERQVLCVTHLAQVASQAHHHYRVEKTSVEDDTRTGVVSLSEAERLEEIARMLGGLEITEQTRAHASQMMAVND